VEGTNEHPSSSLGHSEELSVENPVGPPVPEFCQATEESPKILAGITGEESRYVFEEDGGRSKSVNEVEESEGEAGAGALVFGSHASSLACDAEILAGETARPECCSTPILRPFVSTPGATSSHHPLPFVGSLPAFKSNDVTEVRDSRPSLCEDG
jgi:hypothetical protein